MSKSSNSNDALKSTIVINMKTETRQMIRHILLIEIIPEACPEQIDTVKHAFLQIPEQIEGVTHVEWGVNDSPEGKNQAFTHCILMTFEDESARQVYLPHPQHEALKVIFRAIIKNLIVFDYTV